MTDLTESEVTEAASIMAAKFLDGDREGKLGLSDFLSYRIDEDDVPNILAAIVLGNEVTLDFVKRLADRKDIAEWLMDHHHVQVCEFAHELAQPDPDEAYDRRVQEEIDG